MDDTIYEIHTDHSQPGETRWTVYARVGNGQMRLVGTHVTGPFGTPTDTVNWMLRSLMTDYLAHLS